MASIVDIGHSLVHSGLIPQTDRQMLCGPLVTAVVKHGLGPCQSLWDIKFLSKRVIATNCRNKMLSFN